MILSEENNFLFIKGRKVAGTSVEVALSKFCGPHDIITPITPVDERYRINLGYRYAQNFGSPSKKLNAYINALKEAKKQDFHSIEKPSGTFQSHSTLTQAYSQIGSKLKDVRIVAITRSPYQLILSFLNHMARFGEYKLTGKAMLASPEELGRAMKRLMNALRANRYHRNIDQYKAPENSGLPEVEYLRFETLQADFDIFVQSLGFKESVRLPHLKKGQNLTDSAIIKIASKDELALINDYFDDEFQAFGYQKLS